MNVRTITSHAYTYDSVNRRTGATLEDGSYWNYGYNDRNELTNAQRSWFDSSAVSGQQYGYGYDNIGNRQSSSSGTGFQPVLYTANNLNQYTGIVTPGLKDIIGAALSTNSVMVNSGTADRKGEYFHRQISVSNTNQPVWQNVTNIAGTFTNKGGLVFPAHSQTLAYDADGNMSFDGIWTYKVDGENRLISQSMTNISGIANSNRLKLDFAYDYMGRRISKTVSTWNGSSFAPQSTNLFVYDGWNLLATINLQLSTINSFMWGQDLSGTMTGAGGVGGLLMANLSGTNCFTAYDGNGNITALMIDKSLAARYEYSPFHELIRATGPLAHLNPFRSSTKFWDDENGIVYYGGRYYIPTLGRWLSKDPLQEQGGLNLLAFVLNHPLNRIDTDGRDGDEISLLGSMSIQAGLGALTGGAISGSIATFKKEFLNDGTWKDVIKSAGEGAALGAFMGPLGKLFDGAQETMGFGEGMVGTEFATGLSWGIQGIIGTAGGAGINSMFFKDDKDVQDLIKSPGEQLGIGFAVGMMAGMMKSGIVEHGGIDTYDPDESEFILDTSLQFAGEAGVDVGESIWSTATDISDQF